MRKSRVIAPLIAAIVTSGCSSHLVNWSTQEVTWFACLVLFLTGWLILSANRVASHVAGPSSMRAGPVLCILGLFFLILGSKLDLINTFGSDVPFWDPWGMEGGLFEAALQRRLDPSLLVQPAGAHNPLLSRLLAIALLKLNGQWDPIVETVVNSLIYSLVLAGLCLFLWRLAGRKNLPVFCVMIAISGVLHFSWESTVSAFHGFYFLLAFSLLSMVMLLYSRPFSTPWFLGLVAALLAQFSAGTGVCAPVVVVCVMLTDCLSRVRSLKESAPTIIALVAVAISIFLLVPADHALLHNTDQMNLYSVCARVIGSLKYFAKAAAWPFPSYVFAPVVWLPFFILVRNQFRTGSTSSLTQFLLALGAWVLLNVLAMTLARGSFASRYKDIWIIGVWVNIIIAFYIVFIRIQPPNGFSWYRWTIVAGAAVLFICSAISVLRLNTSDIWMQYYKDIQEVNTARYVVTGDPSSIVNQPRFHIPLPTEFAEDLMKALDNPTLRSILPACIRAPLPLEPAENSGFSAGGIPPQLHALSHRKVLGSWTSRKGPSGSLYLSQPISSGFQWLVLDVAGGGPGTSLEIIPSEGSVIPIDVRVQTSEWKKVVVKVPRIPFRLQAADQSADGWIAFSLPRELAAGGYYIRRILSGSLLIIAAGMMSLLAGLVVMLKRDRTLHDSGLLFR